MTVTDAQLFERFERLCEEYSEELPERDSSGIGTYGEKRLHKFLKRAVCAQGGELEVKLGPYVADVLSDGEIYEIQTGGFYPLKKKLLYFLENTDFGVTVVHPLIADRALIRIDPETGELVRRSRSPKHESPTDVLSELYYVREAFESERVRVLLVQISGDEYRFSERMRGRRQGAYDSEFFPRRMLGLCRLDDTDSVRAILPPEIRAAERFDAASFAKATRLGGTRLSLALRLLCDLGICERQKEGRKYVYLMRY